MDVVKSRKSFRGMTVPEAEVRLSMVCQIVLTSIADRFVVRLSGWKTMQLVAGAFCANAIPKLEMHVNKRMWSDFFIYGVLALWRLGLRSCLH